jgi:acetyl esterase
MPLDPDAAAFLEAYNRAAPPPIWTIPVSEARAGVQPLPGPAEEVGGVRDQRTSDGQGGVPVRIYEPREEAAGTIVYFHGGGWVTGSLDSHDGLCRRLCNASQSRIVAVGYRLAPEHRFPAAVDDAYEATRWAADSFTGGTAVCGDSAGANLAAAVCLMSRDRGGPGIAAQALVYPITDCDFERPSYLENREGYFLTREAMMWFWDQYVPDPDDRADPRVSVLRAADHSRLPPAWILTAGFDVLRDEGEAYADRLRASGVSVESVHRPGLIHGFLRRFRDFGESRTICAEIGRFVQSHLHAEHIAPSPRSIR